MAVKSVLFLWIYGSYFQFVKGDLPQQLTVTEEGSSQTYDCNSYVKRFTAIERVSYEQLRAVGVQCMCSLNVPNSALSDNTEVLSVRFDSNTQPVTYGSFRSCQELGGQLQFHVESSVQQTKLLLRCESNDNILLNSVNRDDPIVVTKSGGFTEAIAMTCESVSLLTTSEMSRTTAEEDTIVSLTNVQPTVTPREKKSAESNTTNIALIVGVTTEVVALLIGVLVTVTVIKCRKTPTPKVPHEEQAYKDPSLDKKATPSIEDTYVGLTDRCAEDTGYTSWQVPRNADYENIEGVYVN